MSEIAGEIIVLQPSAALCTLPLLMLYAACPVWQSAQTWQGTDLGGRTCLFEAEWGHSLKGHLYTGKYLVCQQSNGALLAPQCDEKTILC